MTLILTCLTQDHIIQVVDRRVTSAGGALKDDDTNKAVFYCGGSFNFAVAYTGPDEMGGEPTAKWIGGCIKDIPLINKAMRTVAEPAEIIFRRNVPCKFAVVATGWRTDNPAQPIQPYVALASNFVTTSGKWQDFASDHMIVQGGYPLKNSSSFIFSAGQNLWPQEEAHLKVNVDRVVKSNTAATSIARILGDTIQAIANGRDERAKKVGKGMITHLLPRKAALNKSDILVVMAGLTPDAYSFAYVSSDGRTDPSKSAWHACNGFLIEFEGGSFPRRSK